MLSVSPMNKTGFAVSANSLSCALAKYISPGLGLYSIRVKTSGVVVGGFSSLGIRVNLL